ncbi:SMI1/KNR4 family protein [Paenibacillus lemnae]|uniref:SMI1/KNR4 family protein n=1 Tax=Paenibacillus lemnae TaxID=1330551 RepID=A0A848M2U9_PAELE|nr:SMI1/KNR4 family protein [Paenibacillus lemnae]NMO95328.1 SMI1/KNR4 family protein [Paenibacillus lemnae]
MTNSFETIKERINIIANRIVEIGGEVQEIEIGAPATEDEIKSVEHQLGTTLPESFKQVLLNFSGDFSFRWFFPEEFELPYKYREIFSGIPYWSLHLLSDVEEGRRGCVEQIFPNPEDEYDKVWHNKLAFMEVGNGDYLAFDLSEDRDFPIVYLSHNDGEGHGYIIGNNFIDFLNNWSRIGFVGPEDSQWLPFVESAQSGINPEGVSAIEFRGLLGINI